MTICSINSVPNSMIHEVLVNLYSCPENVTEEDVLQVNI